MTTMRDVMVTALFTIGAQGFAVVIASRSRTANERGLGWVLASLLCERRGRGLRGAVTRLTLRWLKSPIVP